MARKDQQEHKYLILAEAAQHGHRVRFSVLYYATQTQPRRIMEEIGEREGYYIRKHKPPLNTQIPTETDWRHFTRNPKASTITLDEILS